MNKQGIIHEIQSSHAYGIRGDRARFVLKAPRNELLDAGFVWVDKYLYERGISGKNHLNMRMFAKDHYYDYFEVEVDFTVLNLNYYFVLRDEREILYMGKDHFYDEEINDPWRMYHLASIFPEDEFKTPSWAAAAIVYQIFPDRFHPGEDDRNSSIWNGKISHNTFLGGTLKGIEDNLEYMQDLGVNTIYLTPLFKSSSNHRYNTTDYYEVDPRLGNKEDLRRLIQEMKRRKIRIVFDFVFNHTGYDFFAFRDIMEKGESSIYKDWYYIDGFPLKSERGKKPNYKSFGYFYGMPKVNLDHPEASQYFLDVAKYWVKNFDIDGLRMDVADEMSPRFLRSLREEVRSINPEILMIGEIWYDAKAWLKGDCFDTVMNYVFYHGVKELIGKGTMSPEDFLNEIGGLMGNYKKEVHHLLWNLIGSHDTPRFINEAKYSLKRQKLAVLLQMTMPGVPMIYYGDEVGMKGGRDPDNRRGMIWEEDKQNSDLLKEYKRLITLRKNEPLLVSGSFLVVDQDLVEDLLVFHRVSKNERISVIVNSGKNKTTVPGMKGRMDLLENRVIEGELVVKGLSGAIIK